MEHNIVQEPYLDSPPTSPTTAPTSTSTPSPVASRSKPLPPLPTEASPPQEPYRDDPSPPTSPSNRDTASPQPQRYHAAHEVVTYFPPYTDIEPGTDDDDDVPLAHLYPYPTEAPPSYSVAVGQSYRDTLISRIPENGNAFAESDEEEGLEREYDDDVRFKVERIVAAIIVSLVLLIITGVFVGFLVSMRIGTQWFDK